MTDTQKALYNEHIMAGQPDTCAVFVRQGYVVKYNNTYRIADWVAYHIIPDYLHTPKRDKRYKRFRTDPDMDNAVKEKDYTGTGYSRGHLAPYFAMGGDRDQNHVYADLAEANSDPYDDMTIYQANYMSNIAPQNQDAMNGAGGPWYALETMIRNKLVRHQQMELHVVVGCIVNDTARYETLKSKYGDTGIAIPDAFFQVLIYHSPTTGEYSTAAFLFPHVRQCEDLPYQHLLEYIVTVDAVEEQTGLDFLKQLPPEEQARIESNTHLDFWTPLFE